MMMTMMIWGRKEPPWHHQFQSLSSSILASMFCSRGDFCLGASAPLLVKGSSGQGLWYRRVSSETDRGNALLLCSLKRKHSDSVCLQISQCHQ